MALFRPFNCSGRVREGARRLTAPQTSEHVPTIHADTSDPLGRAYQ